MVIRNSASHRRQLLRRLADLGVRLDGIADELVSHDDRDWPDLAVQREGDEVLEGLGRAGADEVRMIRAALARMQAGTYGLCTRCGEQISEDRLSVLPATPLCRHCAQSAVAA